MHDPHSAPEHALLLDDDRLSTERRVAARIADALDRGDRVIHAHTGTSASAEPGLLALLPGGTAGHEQLELVPVTEERARTGGDAARAAAAYAARIERARDLGFPGITCTAESGAWLELVDDVVAFERGLHELACRPGTSVVCAYDPGALQAKGDELDTVMAAVHYGEVAEARWSAVLRGTVVRLSGQLDEANADRLRAVLVRALEGSVHTIDLHDVGYLAPAAVQAIGSAADRAAASDLELRLIRIPAIVRRAFDEQAFAERPGVSMPSLTAITPATGMREESLRVANVFQSLAQLEEATSEAEAMVGLAGTLAQVIASTADVSVTVGPPARPTVVDSTSSFAQQMDGLQMQAGEGPSTSAWDSHALVLTDDIGSDPRWPALAQLAGPSQLASVLALPVRVRDEVVGVVNAYSTDTGAFAGLDIDLAELAAFAVGQVFQRIETTRALRDMVTNLRQALSSRSVIDQAKGILMARHGYDDDLAFTALSELSQRENIKVRDLAALLTEEVQRREQ